MKYTNRNIKTLKVLLVGLGMIFTQAQAREVDCATEVFTLNKPAADISKWIVDSRGIDIFDQTTGKIEFIDVKTKKGLKEIKNAFIDLQATGMDLSACTSQGSLQAAWKADANMITLQKMYNLLYTVLSPEDFQALSKRLPKVGSNVSGSWMIPGGKYRALQRPQKMIGVSQVKQAIDPTVQRVKDFFKNTKTETKTETLKDQENKREPIAIVDYLEMETICTYQFNRNTDSFDACIKEVDRVFDSMIAKQELLKKVKGK